MSTVDAAKEQVMRIGTRTLGILLALFGLLSPLAGARKSVAEAQALIRRATEASDVWSAGAFHLEMQVKFFAVKAGTIDGRYERTSASMRQFRATFSSPEYNFVIVGGNDKVWESSDAGEKPIRVRQFERALAALSQNVVGDNLEFHLRGRKLEHDHGKTPCVQIIDGGRFIEDCFDPRTGVLKVVREDNWKFVFSDYEPIGKKLFPRSVAIFEGLRLVATAQVERLEAAPTPASDLFEPLNGAEVYRTCTEALGFPLGPKGDKLVKRLWPDTPDLPPDRIRDDDMVVSAVVGRDGKLHNLVAEGSNPVTRHAALEAVRQWQYEPFTVCGYPVEMPITFTMKFSRRGFYTGP